MEQVEPTAACDKQKKHATSLRRANYDERLSSFRTDARLF